MNNTGNVAQNDTPATPTTPPADATAAYAAAVAIIQQALDTIASVMPRFTLVQNSAIAYVRRRLGVTPKMIASAITASDPSEKGMMFEPAESKIYRHPTFYDVPDEVGHM